ncbi:hypothetical protein EX30DRAFT_90555 [Ascodesmis nigricans]|uniref:Uncharacterized protein n=1 Tax=Ascodesmis nigricans TaxID=341454 RepID=A0A4S2N3H4_9PEZI|nr:hypothetical protein EX30DRAFT_90555 [Ascodesmis nigricans]
MLENSYDAQVYISIYLPSTKVLWVTRLRHTTHTHYCSDQAHAQARWAPKRLAHSHARPAKVALFVSLFGLFDTPVKSVIAGARLAGRSPRALALLLASSILSIAHQLYHLSISSIYLSINHPPAAYSIYIHIPCCPLTIVALPRRYFLLHTYLGTITTTLTTTPTFGFSVITATWYPTHRRQRPTPPPSIGQRRHLSGTSDTFYTASRSDQ